MPRDKRNMQHLRASVAAAAARLIAEDGLLDFALAKRKAARQLGLEALHVLPDNDEVEEALRVHQSLYQDEEHQECLHELREEALEVMEFLASFRPYVRGGVLKGTAGRYSGIDLQVFAEDSKALEIFLLNNDISFELQPSRRDPGTPVFALDWDGTAVKVAVHPLNEERIVAANGKAAERMNLKAFRGLLAAETAAAEEEEGKAL